MLTNPNSWQYSSQSLDDPIRAKFKILLDGYRKMVDQSFSKSKDLGDMIRFLPGVVVQKDLSMQEMIVLYRVEPDFLERLIKSTIAPLRPSSHGLYPRYILDGILSSFLQDRDRSKLYYCDPELQHISICRRFLSLLDRSNIFDLQSYVFPPNLSSQFLNFDVLVMTSLIMFALTSMAIYVQPPLFFSMHGKSQTTTLP